MPSALVDGFEKRVIIQHPGLSYVPLNVQNVYGITKSFEEIAATAAAEEIFTKIMETELRKIAADMDRHILYGSNTYIMTEMGFAGPSGEELIFHG